MIKTYKGNVLGVPVEIKKLAAAKALKVHARVAWFLSDGVGELLSGVGEAEDRQAELFGAAFAQCFHDAERVDALVEFITEILTDGNVIVSGQRVQHLDDLERFDNVDGTALLYEILGQWGTLNLGALLGKIGSSLNGSPGGGSI